MKRILKITSVILIQTFLLLDVTCCGGAELFASNQSKNYTTLAPRLQINTVDFQDAYEVLRANNTGMPASGTGRRKELNLANESITGGLNEFKKWINNILNLKKIILDDGEILSIANDLDISQPDYRLEKAKSRARASIDFVNSLPVDGKHNVYIFRDSAGLYSAHQMIHEDEPSGIYISKKSFRQLTKLGINADILMLGIIDKAMQVLGKALNEEIALEDYARFKEEFLKAFKEEVELNENLRIAIKSILGHLSQEGVLNFLENGLRFIDTTKKGTFPLLLEGIFSLPLKDLGLWKEDLNTSTETFMFYSELSKAISFSSERQVDRTVESSSYPIEFTGKFEDDFTPIFKETSQADKNLFYLETLVLRNEALKSLEIKQNNEIKTGNRSRIFFKNLLFSAIFIINLLPLMLGITAPAAMTSSSVALPAQEQTYSPEVEEILFEIITLTQEDHPEIPRIIEKMRGQVEVRIENIPEANFMGATDMSPEQFLLRGILRGPNFIINLEPAKKQAKLILAGITPDFLDAYFEQKFDSHVDRYVNEGVAFEIAIEDARVLAAKDLNEYVEQILSEIAEDEEFHRFYEAFIISIIVHELGHVLEDENVLDEANRFLQAFYAHINEYKSVFDDKLIRTTIEDIANKRADDVLKKMGVSGRHRDLIKDFQETLSYQNAYVNWKLENKWGVVIKSLTYVSIPASLIYFAVLFARWMIRRKRTSGTDRILGDQRIDRDVRPLKRDYADKGFLGKQRLSFWHKLVNTITRRGRGFFVIPILLALEAAHMINPVDVMAVSGEQAVLNTVESGMLSSPDILFWVVAAGAVILGIRYIVRRIKQIFEIKDRDLDAEKLRQVKRAVKLIENKIIESGLLDKHAQLVIAIDGAGGVGKTSVAEYIAKNGIAGIASTEIQVLSRDKIADEWDIDYSEANERMLSVTWHEGRLVVTEGHGVFSAWKRVENEEGYQRPQLFIKIRLPEGIRRQRLADAKGQRGRETATEPEGNFDLVIDTSIPEILGHATSLAAVILAFDRGGQIGTTKEEKDRTGIPTHIYMAESVIGISGKSFNNLIKYGYLKHFYDLIEAEAKRLRVRNWLEEIKLSFRTDELDVENWGFYKVNGPISLNALTMDSKKEILGILRINPNDRKYSWMDNEWREIYNETVKTERPQTNNDWIKILEEHGFGPLNIAHTQRNVRAVEYFAQKQKLNAREKEILTVAFWLHDITKDYPLDDYLPEDKKLGGTLRLLVHHLEGAERAEVLLRQFGYDSDFINQVKNIILTHMGPVIGELRRGFMTYLRDENLSSIKQALNNSSLKEERKKVLLNYINELEKGFPEPVTKLERIARDIDLLDLSGDGVEKVVYFRQTQEAFFIDGMPESIEDSFASAQESAVDVDWNLYTATAIEIVKHRIQFMKNFKKENYESELAALTTTEEKVQKFIQLYKEHMWRARQLYDSVLEGLPMPPEERASEDETERLVRQRFEAGMLDAVLFFDVDLMRLKNTYVGKHNINKLLDVLIQALDDIIKIPDQWNAMSFRRGGDEFVAVVNSHGNKNEAVEIARQIKEKVENTVFAVGSLGRKAIDPEVLDIIRQMGANVDLVGKRNILIVPQEEGGKVGKERLEEFIAQVNNNAQVKGITHAPLLLEPSWLDNLDADEQENNQVSFTLSIGVAQAVEGRGAYQQTHDLSAARKDFSKEDFKNTGNGHIEYSERRMRDREKEGEGITTTEEAIDDVEIFKQLQRQANEQEREGVTTGVEFPGSTSVRYHSTQESLRTAMRSIPNHENIIGFMIQGLDYNDLGGFIDAYVNQYSEDYENLKTAKDNRILIRDFKVINEAWGYIAGDEAIARFRIAAMKFSKMFEIFDVVLARGPPAGPIGFLVPKTDKLEDAQKLTPEETERMFEEYAEFVQNEFNKDSLVKVGHVRVVWDKFKSAEERVDTVLERLDKVRTLNEYDPSLLFRDNAVIRYNNNVDEEFEILQETLAWEAVEQQNRLKQGWQQNQKQQPIEQKSEKGELGIRTLDDSYFNLETVEQAI